jgi:hypothetical protein
VIATPPPNVTVSGKWWRNRSAIWRISASAADPRPRHQGVSHHSLTAFGELAGVALRPVDLVVPAGLLNELAGVVESQLSPLRSLHSVVEVPTSGLTEALASLDLALRNGGASLSTMGRGLSEDTRYFLAAAAAGRHAAGLVP